ncbi:MAG: DegT/DnrJ/EryC1/StrS family aminotransferase [Gammaproteobacteria bacterium]|nr:DegT/DnrJ/EryC1/StrS family aminotransferase [Gammaproteobacteria bacterium]
MTIKVWDYIEEYKENKDEILKTVDEVFSSGWLILGDAVKSFEENFSSYCSAEYGIGVDNATNGLFLALKALGIGKGDEVISVSNTAVPTISAIVSAGATPIFVDIDDDTYQLNTSLLEEAITPSTKCILPVHLYGQCVDMDPIIQIARERSLYIVEDCSQAHGAKYKGKPAGSMSDLAVFSFYPTKPLGGFGDGGMVLTSNKDLRDKMKRLRFYGMEKTYYAEEHGYNARLDEVHAAILLKKLIKLDASNDKRRALAKRYDEVLGTTSLKLPVKSVFNEHVYYLYVARHKERDRIISELKKKDIFLNVSYPWPIHTMRGYSYLGYQEGDLPNTEKASKEIFSLPMYTTLRFEQQDVVCSALSEILGDSISL